MPFFNYKNRNIHYEEIGKGEPLFLLHGNTGSMKMFDSILDLYTSHYRVLLIDFLGHGKSDRIDEFPLELWFEEAAQTIALIEQLNLSKVNLLGTSGGAWVAMNVALERPDLVNKIIADSFDGRELALDFPAKLRQNRFDSKRNEYAIQFYKACQGDDWEKIVDQDTDSLLRFIEAKLSPFHKELSKLSVPLLLTASKVDDLIRHDIEDEYDAILSQVRTGEKRLFESGYHPAVISNDQEFAKIVQEFLSK